MENCPQNSSHPPFLSGGNVYVCGRGDTASTDHLAITMKATDPTDSWARQDEANEPSNGSGNILLSMWCVQDGTDLHVFQMDDNDDPGYSMFDMSSDAWQDVDPAGGTQEHIIIDTAPNSDSTATAITGWVRSDGDKCAVYQGETDMLMGTEYNRLDFSTANSGASAWSSPVSVDNGGADHWTSCVIVPGKDDRMHVFFKNDDLFDGFQRRINSDDSLETFPSAYDSDVSGFDYNIGAGVSYDDGGTQRVRCPYRSGLSKVSIAKCDSEDTPTVTTDDNVSDNNVKAVNQSIVAALAVDTKDLQLLYSDATDADLYRDTNDDDAGWGTDTEELDGVTVNHISSNVYDRSGTKLAFIYDDGGTVKYNEIVLVAAVIPTISLTMAPYTPAER